jgi:hypothetical protein
MIAKQKNRKKKQKKQRKSDDDDNAEEVGKSDRKPSSSDSDDKPNSDNVSPYSLNYAYLFDYHRNVEAPLHKRQKVEQYSAEIIVEIVDSKNNLVPIRALLDTGTLETILLKHFLSPNSPKGYKGASVTWKTLGGNFTTHRRAKIQFAFPELSDKKTISLVVHVHQHTHPNTAMYDMIIGMDCMCSLGIYVDTDEKVITWEGNSIPLKERGKLQEPGLLHKSFIPNRTSGIVNDTQTVPNTVWWWIGPIAN